MTTSPPMRIVTLNHRHRFDLPEGYVSKTERAEMERLVHHCLMSDETLRFVPDASVIIARESNGNWSLYFTTQPIDAWTLEVINSKLTAFFDIHRKS